MKIPLSTANCQRMFEAAKNSGMRLYNLVSGFEKSTITDQKIGKVSIEPPGASKIYENSVHLIDKEKSDLVCNLLAYMAKLMRIFGQFLLKTR